MSGDRRVPVLAIVFAGAFGGCFFPMGGAQSGPPPARSGGYPSGGSGGYASTSAGGYEPTSAGGYESASSGSTFFSMTLHNSCSSTVNLYVGDGTPPFGSGTYTSIGSNTTQSESGSVPETFWIVDESRNPISSFSPQAGSQSIQILSSCSGFAPY